VSQYSPDGRWWWDGQRWVPVTGARATGAKLEQAFSLPRFLRAIVVGRVIGCVIGFAILVFGAAVVLGVCAVNASIVARSAH
jgi:hypothetical protein